MRSQLINKLAWFLVRHSDDHGSGQNLTRDSWAAGKTLFRIFDNETWLRLLLRSVHEPIIDGVEMPRFPHGKIQREFVGSHDETALREAFGFYRYVKNCFSTQSQQFVLLERPAA
jgi:hypothetical protein